ncbi:NUDIX domain-containing protein [Streptomyces kaniharaensis]|uniref:NUDIX domain-containing protein n=1 Tax=Streptomyces kaniharaensis TaxID=212423 RepID=UPI00389A1FEA
MPSSCHRDCRRPDRPQHPLPSGLADEGESPLTALGREPYEEPGLDLAVLAPPAPAQPSTPLTVLSQPATHARADGFPRTPPRDLVR